MNWLEIDKKPRNKMIEISSQRVYMHPNDVDKLIELQGDEDYDDEGYLDFSRLGETLDPSILKQAQQRMGNKLPLNEYEEEEYWNKLLSDFKTKGQDGDTEAVILPPNIIELFDNITGRRNINPRTGHKQYASMSGFLSGLSSMLPSFSRAQAAPVGLSQTGALNLGTAPNMGPRLSNMYGIPGQNAFSNISNALSSMGSNIMGGLRAAGRGMYGMGQSLYNRLPNNPFRRTPAPANTWEATLAPWGRATGEAGGGYLGGLLGRVGGGYFGPHIGALAAHNTLAMPGVISRPLGAIAGGLLGMPLGGAVGGYLGGRTGGWGGEQIGRMAGRGMDYIGDRVAPVMQRAAAVAAPLAAPMGTAMQGLGGALSAINNYSPASMGIRALSRNPAFVEAITRPPNPARDGMTYGMAGFTDDEYLPAWRRAPETQPLLARDRSSSTDSFVTANGNEWPEIDDVD